MMCFYDLSPIELLANATKYLDSITSGRTEALQIWSSPEPLSRSFSEMSHDILPLSPSLSENTPRHHKGKKAAQERIRDHSITEAFPLVDQSEKELEA